MYTLNDLTKYEYFKDIKIEHALDSLTGVLARNYIIGFAKKLIEDKTPFSLYIMDIDNFKQINDQYGHNIGDKILLNVGKAAQQVFSSESVYRFGGDEFIIIKNDLSLKEFKDKIKTLQKLASNIEVDENNKGITLSFGYTYGVVSHVIDIRSMMKFADELLYEVKRSGKNNSLGKRYDLDMVDETK